MRAVIIAFAVMTLGAALSGCAVVDVGSAVVGAGVSAAGTAVDVAGDVISAPIDAATGGSDDKKDKN